VLFLDAAGYGFVLVTGPVPPPAGRAQPKGDHSGAALVLPLIKGSLQHS